MTITYMSRKKRDTVSKTTRLIEGINEALQRYADDQLCSENAAINKLLKDRLTELGYLKVKAGEE